MKIANKISFSFLAIVLVLMSTIGTIIYIITKHNLQESIYNNLKTTVTSRTNHIETYLKMLEISAGQLSKSMVLENFLVIKDKAGPRQSEAFQQAMHMLKKTKETNSSIFEFLLLDATGKVAASSNESSIGADKSTDAIFLDGQKNIFIKDVYYSELFNEPLIAVSAPFLDSHTGQLLGVLVARVRLNKLNNIVTNKTGMGKTGEIYIVNKYGFMITPSRFIEDAVLKQKIDTENLRRAWLHKDREHVLQKDEIVGVFPDYRGQKVMGAHEFMSRMHWAVLAEINTEEAFAPLAKIRYIFSLILFIAVNTAWLSGIYIARFLSGPIHKLHKGTEIIGSGNLDYKVGTDAKDEVGQLSRAFDAMTENLKNTTTSIEHLNKEVIHRKWAEMRLRQSEEMYRSLFESSHDAIMILISERGFISGNPATIKLFGCKDEKQFTSLTPADLSPKYQPDGTESSVKAPEMMKIAMEKGSHFFEWMHKRMDNTEFPATVLLTRTEIKGEKVLQATVRDITESKKAEKEMKEAVEMKAKFVSTASHELRTPLTSIKEGINLVYSGMTGPLNDDQKEFLGIAKRNVDRLARLINDVLDFQKISAGRMAFNMKPAGINEAVTLVEETMRPLAKEKGLDFIIEIDQAIPPVNFDKDKIIQVLTNLINNAIKFTETGSIKVTTSLNDNNIITSVKDSGCGIKQEDIPRLFQEFEQLATADSERKTGGTGLGLAISRKIIENHGGKIWAESDYGKGTTFYFELPVEAIPCQVKS